MAEDAQRFGANAKKRLPGFLPGSEGLAMIQGRMVRRNPEVLDDVLRALGVAELPALPVHIYNQIPCQLYGVMLAESRCLYDRIVGAFVKPCQSVLPLQCDAAAFSVGVEYVGTAYAVAVLCMHSTDVLPSQYELGRPPSAPCQALQVGSDCQQ